MQVCGNLNKFKRLLVLFVIHKQFLCMEAKIFTHLGAGDGTAGKACTRAVKRCDFGITYNTGQNRRFDRCILDWTSGTASKEASPEGKVLDIFKRSKYINKS